MQASEHLQKEEIYTVSRLNGEVRLLLEKNFPFLWVEGEISNFAAPQSGHWYFGLKDAGAQVRCAMFRANKRKLDFVPKDGMHVLVKTRVSLYENRGDFQLIVEEIEERGEGKLQRAFELLKKKLQEAGLFDPQHKKNFPAFPQQIGVITSDTGAAIRDILIVLKRRFPCVPIIIYPTLVQGITAAPAIVKAIQTANHRAECDILMIARGGGSLEDLWPFNEEIVARAIYESKLPIISGIGHEVDFTIADFVADKRAPTPSAAAEMITPNINDIHDLLNRYHHLFLKQAQQKIAAARQQITWVQKHLYQQHPKRLLLEKMQRVDFYESTFFQHVTRVILQWKASLRALDTRLRQCLPTHRIKERQHELHTLEQQLALFTLKYIQKRSSELANLAGKLDALSPLATLKRGYAIAVNKKQELIRTVSQTKKGEHISVRLLEGKLVCEVLEITQ